MIVIAHRYAQYFTGEIKIFSHLLVFFFMITIPVSGSLTTKENSLKDSAEKFSSLSKEELRTQARIARKLMWTDPLTEEEKIIRVMLTIVTITLAFSGILLTTAYSLLLWKGSTTASIILFTLGLGGFTWWAISRIKKIWHKKPKPVADAPSPE